MKNRFTLLLYFVIFVSIGYPWLRLIKSKEKNPLISYDSERIEETNHVRNTYDSKNNYFYLYIYIFVNKMLNSYLQMNKDEF